MFEVRFDPRAPDGYQSVLEPADHARLLASLGCVRDAVGSRRLWHVNSTAEGGGVAELLAGLLPYQAHAGVDVHWLVIEGGDEFFQVTKRIHNLLHGESGDHGDLGTAERSVYDSNLAAEADDVVDLVQPGDLVVLHDPQVAGLVPFVRAHGAHAVWRCHIGLDEPNALAERAYSFLLDDVRRASAVVFSRAAHVWPLLQDIPVAIIPPCIDVLSTKNRTMSAEAARAILHACGALRDESAGAPATFVAGDGSVHRIERLVEVVEEGPLRADDTIVVQVSRWDRLKDPFGLIEAFAANADAVAAAHLVLAGPATDGVADDPESADVFGELHDAWSALSDHVRRRVHLLRIPVDDADENAAIVNALQRRADVVVQKSLAEGFGLTVAEAMWKARPVVASSVGGIQDQIDDGVNGVLVDDPEDAVAVGEAIAGLVRNKDRARCIGTAGHRKVCDHLLPFHHFEQEAALYARVVTP